VWTVPPPSTISLRIPRSPRSSSIAAKCSTLAGLAGAAAAFTASQAAGHTPLAMRAITAAAGLAFTAAVLVLLVAVLRPRLDPAGWSGMWAMTDEQAGHLAEHGRHGSPECAVSADDFGPADLLALSRIADAKFRRLRLAVDLLAAGVVLLCAGMLTAVIA